MKKTVAILLLSIHLVNLGGGALFFEYLIQKNDRSLLSMIDAGEYKQEQLVEMKIPLPVAYYSSSMNYERYYGEFDRDGRFYNFAMRKVCNDTVYILCLANDVKSTLIAARAGFLFKSGDSNSPGSSGKGSSAENKKANLATEYFQYSNLFDFQYMQVKLKEKQNIFSSPLYSCIIELPEWPPEIPVAVRSFHKEGNETVCTLPEAITV